MKECPACKRCFADEIVHCPEDGEATTPSLIGEPVLDGRYQLEQRLGQGGMGVVYRARHIFLKTQHAIKVILPDLVGNDPNLATRFRQEAMAAANVRHPNIIAVTDFGIVRGNMPFLVMEYVQGESLHDILQREKSLSPERALELMSAICGGMAAAHRQNIVHRDLKPLNIMLQEGMPVQESVRILDFGLAKIKSGEILGSFVAAQTSGLMGSPFYMAPEQWSDEEPDARADIYSLGVMLYQMLAGEVPFKGASIPSIMRKHLTEPPNKMSDLGVDVPPEVEAVVRHCLEKDPASRPQTVDEFLLELRGAIVGTGELLNQTIVDFVQNTNPNLGAPSTRDLQQNPGVSTSSNVDQAEKLNEASFQHIPEAIEAQKLREQAAILEAKARQSAELQRQDMDRLVQSGSISSSQVLPPEPVVEKVTTSGPITPPSSFEASDGDLVNFGNTNPDRPAFNTQAITPAEASAAISAAPAPVPSVASVAPRAKKSSLVPILAAVAAVLVLLVGGGSYGVYRYLQSRATVNADPKTQNGGPDTPPNTPPKTEDPPVVYKPDMAAIPGGKFTMGTNDGPFPERPAHSESVAPFSMDKTEVVNGEYAQFVRETGYQP
ncbi:MAG: bifunctional serine/threonine-protein kinase/formylglycine-generating enzyme family protein, partial [Pyrinomonadaceae bacterium]